MIEDEARLPSAEMLAHWIDISGARVVPGRGVCAMRRFIFTDGLLVNLRLDETGCEYDLRYCYADRAAGLEALRMWDGRGDPPGPWIKEKVSGRLGPGAVRRDSR